jgi:hypothetical protein
LHLTQQIDRSQNFFWHRLRWQLVSSFLPAEGTFELIDVGAGAGVLGSFLQQERPSATYRFVEPIASLETYLERRFGPAANARREITFSRARFATLLDVLEHQQDDRAFIHELARKLRPGTTVLMTVPAMQSLWSRWDVALGHYRRYDRRRLLRCVNGSPLEAREVTYLFPELVPAAIVRKWLRASSRSSTMESFAFPDLPAPVNKLLYRLGRLSLDRRSWWPIGTSLFARLVRKDG